jgi:phosphomannomutase
MDQSIFKAYDIRGIYPEQIDKETAGLIARGFVQFLKRKYPDQKAYHVVVGRDMRLSSPSLTRSVIRGVTAMGADVIDIGLSSTPTFNFAVGFLGADGGMQVSASHNPKEYNGMKIILKKGYPVGLANGLDEVARLAQEKHVDAKSPGLVTEKKGILEETVKYSRNFYDFSGLGRFRIVADAANAMGALDLEAFSKSIDCELVKMNFELDGSFPVHEADPMKERNVADLKERVVKEKADLGIATDGDADRYFYVDDKGELVDPAIMRGIMARFVLRQNPGANIGYDIRPGMITRDMIVENGGKPFVTKVGHSLIKLEALKHNAPFSGESSGHFFFKTKYGLYEMPHITTLILLKELSDSKKSLSEYIRPLQRYFHSGEINSRVQDVKKVFRELEEQFGTGAKISKLDGISIEHDDYWFNLRASNTEPKARLNIEARTKEKMEEMRDRVLAVIRG